MKQTLHDWMEQRLGRLRGCILLTLLLVGGWLCWSGGQVSAPVESQAVEKTLEGFTVALDPGHGGYDGGARAHDSGIWEKEMTLQIALVIEQELLERGATVVMTRREDVCLCDDGTGRLRKRKDLQARMNMAIEANADVLLSIHMNEYRRRSESGPQVFYQHGGDDGRLLAGVLQQALVDTLQPPKVRTANAGNYYVLRSKLPSALVECGFISNPEEEKLLLSQPYREKIAQALADGLTEYRELLSRLEKGEPVQ